jgi:hypothetical protein
MAATPLLNADLFIGYLHCSLATTDMSSLAPRVGGSARA